MLLQADMIEPNSKITLYDLYDSKILYFLTQYFLFNYTHYPFLLYRCQRGEEISNSDHVCKIIDNDDQVKYYNRSLYRWNHTRNHSKKISNILKSYELD